MKGLYVSIFTSLIFVSICSGQTVYFLVADTGHTESYVLPLTNSEDINHARDLVEYGPGIGAAIVVAHVTCGGDGINRDYLAPTEHAWNWHVTDFVGFADNTIEILDGGPHSLLLDCDGWINNTGGLIGFWLFTVVEELQLNPGHWQCDFIYDDQVNMNDLAVLGSYWLRDNCTSPDWCGGTDLNKNTIVDVNELSICAAAWLSPNPYAYQPYWFDAWNCPTQCHGDANCESEAQGLFEPMCPVGQADMTILLSAWPLPVYCGDGTGRYDPRVDFDRDCDIDDNDTAILEYWLGIPEDEFPTDCPIYP